MVDTLLMAQLLQAVHVSSRLILVGDVFQLPSVGAGNVLADLIRSQAIRTFELNEIFRQDRESAIILNAHRVRRGAQPVIAPSDFSGQATDFYFFEEERPGSRPGKHRRPVPSRGPETFCARSHQRYPGAHPHAQGNCGHDQSQPRPAGTPESSSGRAPDRGTIFQTGRQGHAPEEQLP